MITWELISTLRKMPMVSSPGLYFPQTGLGLKARIRRAVSRVALRRHHCRDELQSLQVRLSPDPQIPRACVGCHTVGETRRLSVPTQTPSPSP